MGLRAEIQRTKALVVASRPHDTSPDDLAATVALMRATMPQEPGAEGAALEASLRLPRRWQEPTGGLRYHPEQARARAAAETRHRCIEAGRRSGKSEDRKREIAIRALDPAWPLERRYIVVGAPTQDQTEALYFDDLLGLIPARFVRRVVRSRPRIIETVTGARIKLAGMDRPQRSEGEPIDDLFLDEFADMKPEVWESHLAPSLETPGRPRGRVTFYGTPDLRSGLHFVDLCDLARERMEGGDPEWGYFHWSSQGIVSEETWDSRRSTMDAAQFAVEFEARRVSTGNLVYYGFDRGTHLNQGLRYMPSRPLVVCADWNWDPATAVLCQEQVPEQYEGGLGVEGLGSPFTAVLGEVFIRRSNTPEAMRAVLAWMEEHEHKGEVWFYGDPAGGAKGSAKVEGSDLDLVEKVLRPVLHDRLVMAVARRAPAIRARVNAMNSRFKAADGSVRMLVHPDCRELVRDFDMVQWKEGASYEIEKKSDSAGKLRTHLSDGLGYYVEGEFPVEGEHFRTEVW